MNSYIFNSHIDFGIFCKVNFDYLLEVFDDSNAQGVPLLTEVIKAYENTQGGCPCSLKKRTATAVESYKKVTNLMSSNEALKSAIKELLADPDSVDFKENADGISFLTF